MDLDAGDELNYEQEMTEDELDDSGSKDGKGDSPGDSNRLEPEDEQYLQIDYLQDENLMDETPPPSPPKVAEEDGKATEVNQQPNKESISPPPKEPNISKSFGGRKIKRKKKLGPFQRRPQFNKKFRKSLCLNPWLPEYNLDVLNHVPPQFFSRGPMLDLHPDFHQQMPNGFLNSPIFGPTVGIRLSTPSYPQISNIAALKGQCFNNVLSNYRRENGKMSFPGSFGFQGMNGGIRNPGVLDQSLNFIGFYNQRPGAGFAGQDPNKRGDGFINVQYKSLDEDEKKILMQKKEDRLKRFKQDDVIRKDKLTDSGFEESSSQDGSPTTGFVQKKEKIVCQKKENLLCASGAEGKPDINKESLLRKVNPFGVNLATSEFGPGIKPKAEKVGVKVEREDCEVWEASKCPGGPLTKPEAKASTSLCPGPSLGPVKTEKERPVKFVRTISKSFQELTFKKPKSEVAPEKPPPPPPQGELLPFGGLKTCCGRNDFPKKVEPQLTGCIVKVLNIPPSTTTNDILALCSPIGIAVEVKLNCPKENSVVIRFAEPKCAENFFSLYHGQKMNNYFLNVIVV